MPITSLQKIDEYYKALLDRDSKYVGIFYVGVKTTSIFCISTCRARKPKKENVHFYGSIKEAMDYGFRACKICKPTENTKELPPSIQKAIELVQQHPKEKISDYQLRQLDISPDIVRRWFKKHYGLTFHAYQRMFRINNAYLELQRGKKMTDSAFESGYESLSGFSYTYKKIIGKPPSKSKGKTIIYLQRITSVLGAMFLAATDQGVCLLEFTDRKMLETEFRDLQKLLDANILIGENTHLLQAKKEISEYFQGNRSTFEVALHTPGTDFQQLAWAALQDVDYGTTSTYQAQAIALHRPKSVRAIARANGYNRIAIMVPCHRIIGKNGNLTGYGGGIERKRWLIDFEKKNKALQ